MQEYVEAYHIRMERQAYMYYNLAGTIACMVLNSRKPEPYEAFPGWIKHEMRVMTDEELYASCLAWCGMGEEVLDASGETQ